MINGFEELIKFLKGEKGSFKKIIDEVFEASNIKKIGFQGGKILSESEIEDWAKLVMKKYVYDNLVKMLKNLNLMSKKYQHLLLDMLFSILMERSFLN
ncbi:hypothetical protein [uncultured Chryseobacterium sp.]|uniref:hypothetical protein n=1 Tax=uncultured Chryseobacterium sp. TaxID=259322 RepID=UPI0025CC974B|nr:hypothetical protein [uncultured Chryseobacterium sp.]